MEYKVNKQIQVTETTMYYIVDDGYEDSPPTIYIVKREVSWTNGTITCNNVVNEVLARFENKERAVEYVNFLTTQQ